MFRLTRPSHQVGFDKQGMCVDKGTLIFEGREGLAGPSGFDYQKQDALNKPRSRQGVSSNCRFGGSY